MIDRILSANPFGSAHIDAWFPSYWQSGTSATPAKSMIGREIFHRQCRIYTVVDELVAVRLDVVQRKGQRRGKESLRVAEALKHVDGAPLTTTPDMTVTRHASRPVPGCTVS